MSTVVRTKPMKAQARAARRSQVTQTLLAAALLVWLALVPVSAMALDAAGGSDTNVNQVVNTVGPGAWVTLVSQQINAATGGTRHCIATGSSDTLNPGTLASEQYRFTLSLAAGADPIDSGRERRLEFSNTAVTGDNVAKEITSTWFFTLPPPTAVYFIRWRATKFAAATANLTVLDSSLSVVCTDVALPN